LWLTLDRWLYRHNAVVAAQQLTYVGYMAHARRKFSEAGKAQGKNSKASRAQQGLAWIKKL